MFSRIVPGNRNGSCSTMPICATEIVLFDLANIHAVDQDRARR